MSESPLYSLRDADEDDYEFLFCVLMATRESKKIFNWQDEFRDFKKSIRAYNSQVVMFQGRHVGRFRMTRSPDSIYVGGIQLVPAFQNKGIGSAIFADLIQESEQKKIPVLLEVFVRNESAFRFYTRHGFVEEGAGELVRQMIRMPKT